ncbi:hypothetical protein GTP55_11630 [Duganella sp. FT109W]|uniref:Uncharacterized protein n=1 Tax=Duganella margarita TaxID=2692170 RepID=A0ABW9WI35_9BURK|nr:hypothetical protein [Duganella margarita]MYN40024.1 hypothetical protein [Duganella margarita]
MPIILTTLLAAHTLAAAAAQKEAVAELTPPALAAPAQPALTDDVIRKAVRETVAETPPAQPLAINAQAGAFRANSVEAPMSAAFEQAKVPDCLHQDALKLQPARIGPVNVVGPYSLPWVIAAVVRGKCN